MAERQTPVSARSASRPPSDTPADVASIFEEALGGGKALAGAKAERGGGAWVTDQPEITGKQGGAAQVHRDVADKLREAGQDELADAFDVYAEGGDALAGVYRGEGSANDLPAINAEMDAVQERIEDLADDLGMKEEAPP
jgi:hypothetical protein